MTCTGGMVKPAAAALGLLILAGCQSILPIGNAPERTFALRYDAEVPANKDNVPVIFLDDPLLVEGLGGQSLTVVLDGGERTSLQNLRWATDLATLVRDYIDRRLMVGTNAEYVGDGGLDIRATCRLQTKFWAFELRPGPRASDDRVVVSLEASLISLGTGALLAREQMSDERGVGPDASTEAVVMRLEQSLSAVSDALTAFMDAHLKDCN